MDIILENLNLELTSDVKQFLKDAVELPYLRIEVVKGGCSGFSYSIEETNSVKSTDYRIPVTEDLTIIVDKEIGSKYLNNLKLELVHTEYGESLRFVNPNAKRSCGCGDSFGV
jgi:iron-sulfur cluster assembly accessory protein